MAARRTEAITSERAGAAQAKGPARRLGPVRAFLLVGLILIGAALGVGWGWASPTPVHRTFEMNARQFAFDPGILRANKGDRIEIHVTSSDVTHGLYVDGFGARTKIAPGQTGTLVFEATKTGRFAIRCSETCGVFHPFMTGTLIVEPNLVLPGSIGAALGVAVAGLLYAGWTTRRASG